MTEFNKFQSVVERLMNDEELKEAFDELKLEDNVRDFITEQFQNAYDALADDPDITEDDIARGNGKLGLYMSFENVRDDLTMEMGLTNDYGKLSPEDRAKVDAVFTRFFDE